MLAAAGSLAVSWQTWISPFADGGRELDIPARIVAGERVYRDFDYYYGPLAPWLNSLAVRFLGHCFLAIELVGLLLAAGILALLYAATLRAGSATSAMIAVTLTAALCVGGTPGAALLFPYSFATVLALGGGLIAVFGMMLHSRRSQAVLLFFGLSIALLSRIEMGLGLTAILVCSFFLPTDPQGRRNPWPPLAMGAAWALALSVYAESVRGLTASRLVAQGPLSFLHPPQEWASLYKSVAGLSSPPRLAAKLLVSVLLDAGLLSAAWLWARTRERFPSRGRILQAAWDSVVIGAGVLLAFGSANAPGGGHRGPLVSPLLPLPILCACGAFVAFLRSGSEKRRERFLLFAFAALWALRVEFALSVGSRMNSYCGAALPGVIACAAVSVFDVLAVRAPVPSAFKRSAAVVFGSIGVFFLLRIGMTNQRASLERTDTPAGSLRLPRSQAAAVTATLRFLAGASPKGLPLVTLPEAGFFQFLTGRRNPLREEQIIPGILSGDMESDIIDRLKREPPVVVLVVNRPTVEYGQAAFGRDYGRALLAHVVGQARLAFATPPGAGAARIGDPDFFIQAYVTRPVTGPE
jgi:hypothetical protein